MLKGEFTHETYGKRVYLTNSVKSTFASLFRRHTSVGTGDGSRTHKHLRRQILNLLPVPLGYTGKDKEEDTTWMPPSRIMRYIFVRIKS